MKIQQVAVWAIAAACAVSGYTSVAHAGQAEVTVPTPTSVPVKAEYGLAALDNRIGKPMFEAAQDLASAHQCERLLRVRSVDGDNAHFFSRCDSGGAPIEILCNATRCHEGPPQG
jgi:hypothetical protein